MKTNWATKLFCLIGNPVDGSHSPIIHNYLFSKLNYNGNYMTFNLEKEGLNDAIKGFKSIGLKGFNITSPFKESIIPFLDNIDDYSKSIGAINTVKINNGVLFGTNTDGLGFLKMFNDEGIDLNGKNIILIGAGGAAKGLSFALIKKNLKKLSIINRTKEKADLLKKDLDGLNSGVEIETYGINEDFNKSNCDILINTTTVGMAPDINNSPISLEGFNKEVIVCDIIYKPLKTLFLKEAEDRGYRIFNGIPMLINQAILAEEFWLDITISEDISLELKEYINNYLEKGLNYESK